MAVPTRRQRNYGINIWPGFVDGLAQLLMVIIFVLLVFTAGQFYLTSALSGRDEALQRMQQQLNELSDLLALERRAGTDLRSNVTQLSSQLQASAAARDTLTTRVAELATKSDETTARANRMSVDLAAAQKTLAVDKDKIDLQIKEIASLQSDLASLRQLRAQLEAQVADMAAALQKGAQDLAQSQERSKTLEGQLAATTAALQKSSQDLAAERDRSKSLQTQLAGTTQSLQKSGEELAAERDRSKSLQAQLADTVAALQRSTQDLAAERDRSKSLQTQLATTSASLQKSTQDLAAERDRSKSLQTQLATTSASLQKSTQDLAAERDRSKSLQAQLADRTTALQKSASDLAAERDRSQKLQGQLTDTGTALQASNEALTSVRDRSKALEARLATEEERTALAQKEIDNRDVRLKQSQDTVDQLNQQLLALRDQLQRIETDLEASEKASSEQQVQIADLGRRLNMALASKVEELARYRSEFFGRLRQILGDRPDIRIVGDRFVFQSEVLFDLGSAELTDSAKQQLAPLATALKEIAGQIPADIDWVLRVDGHTDKRPIANSQFKSNWELSAARAISVVKYLIDQGIPANRLAAAGFGEYQPLDSGNDETAFRRNRRIELKLTDR